MISSKLNTNKPMTLGILGAGQLAKMTAQEAYKMGLNISVIDKSEKTPAGDMTKEDYPGSWDNQNELQKFIESSDLITLENEFIDPEILKEIEKSRTVYPSSKTISKVQDKFIQKSTFKDAGIPLPDFDSIDSEEDAENFGETYGYPFLLKTRTLGYDGYGNFTVKSKDDISKAFEKFKGRALLAESFVDFKVELAVMAVRSSNGEEAIYPCVETYQKNHICHEVFAPARFGEEITSKAQEMAMKCVKAVDGVGVFGIEMFLTQNDEILVNEIAPRPHNTGHYTIEACYTSQFENGLRAVLGLPLGSTEMVKDAAVMINLLGEREGSGVPENVDAFLKHKKAKLHLYNKKSSRIGRKMGHITLIGDDLENVISEARKAVSDFVW